MSIEVTGRHISITDSMRDYATQKAEKTVATFRQIEKVHIILDVQKYRQIAEVVIQGQQSFRFEAQEVSDDMYASIDLVMDIVDRHLQKVHGKVVDKHKRDRTP
jgi:putative sigma-54 modulation protein